MAEAIILKNSKRQAVVQFNGPGSVYANLHSLLHANVGGYTEQTFTNSNAIATITFINATTSGSGNVIRTVDGVATVVGLTPGEKWAQFDIKVPDHLTKYIVNQG